MKTESENIRFADMGLSPETLQGLETLGYELATPVQSAAFGPAMSGRDLVVQSKTGTGKTTAFGLPLVESVNVDEQLTDPQALVLCPTRELAIQIAEEIAELGDPKGVRVLSIYGGAKMGPQLSALKAGCDVVVGTPGRILDHISRRTLRLVHVKNAVLDEADEMLSMGFWDDVTTILDKLPNERQTLLFSATLPDQIRRAAAKYLREPERIDISRDEMTVEGIDNVYYTADDRLPKPRNLLYILEVEKPETAIIFCNTRDDTSTVAQFLRRQGLNALALSGDFGQKERERIMGRMRRGDLKYLVATDIAARGIDISDLTHVFQYSLPEFNEVYLHRVGRTGRIGKTGTAISLVHGRGEFTLKELKSQYNIDFTQRTLPPKEEILKLQAERVGARLVQEAREVELASFMPLAAYIRDIDGSQEAIALLLRSYFAQVGKEREEEAREEDARMRKLQQKRIGGGQDDDRAEPKSKKKKKPKKSSPTKENEPQAVNAEDLLSDTVRLFINRGRNHGYSKESIRDLIAEIGKSDANGIARVELRHTHAFAETSEELANAAITAAEVGIERENKPVTIERARTR